MRELLGLDILSLYRFMLINLPMSGRGALHACIRMSHLMEVASRALTKDGTQL